MIKLAIKFISSILVLSISLPLMAQTASPPAAQDNEFIAIVQFVEGQPEWKLRPQRKLEEKISFKSFLHRGEVIKMPSRSFLKLITAQRCIGAAYGEGLFFGGGDLIMPKSNGGLSWGFDNISVRWICDRGQSQILNLDGNKVTLTQGEIFYHKKELYVRKGKLIAANNQKLKGLRSYKFDGKKWIEVKGRYEQNQLWKFNRELPLPKESAVRKKPFIRPKLRLIINGSLGLNNKMGHKNFHYNMKELKLNGGQATINYHLQKKWSLLASVKSQTISDGRDSIDFMTTPDVLKNELKIFTADLGLRLSHYKNWSYYGKIGVGEATYTLHSYFVTGNRVEREEKYNVISLTAGIDRIFLTDWLERFGLFSSIEFYAMHSFTNTGSNLLAPESLPMPNADDVQNINGNFWLVGFTINLGPLIQF